MQEEKDYASEQEIQIEEMGDGGADTGESIAEENNGEDVPPIDTAVK